MGAKGKRNPQTTSGVAIEHVKKAMDSLAEAFQHVRRAEREAHRSDQENLTRLEDFIFDAYMDSIGLYRAMAHEDRPRRNPLSDAEHQEADRRAHQISNRMRKISYREGRLGNQDGADYWEGQEAFIRGAGWAHNRAAQGSVFPSDLYAGTSGLDDHEAELLVDEREAAGPVANPVKADGKWHKTQFIDIGETKGTAYGMQTAKGGAHVVPYKPRTFLGSTFAAEGYELYERQKVPKGTRFILITKGDAEGSELNYSAHKTLDDAKRAGENALRKLPMPNPAPRLVNEGLLAGSRPIPSGLDSPRYNEGILAGSRPIPSGLDSPRVNAGIVDPPITRRSKPEQPF